MRSNGSATLTPATRQVDPVGQAGRAVIDRQAGAEQAARQRELLAAVQLDYYGAHCAVAVSFGLCTTQHERGTPDLARVDNLR